ncbi:hypothetical protein, partial [Klebsiella pneumoniae]|uniref:hypothetical protein n=1 Tax=Klebsiella pneumoniae TaxID=573 RepID=UPI0040555971
GTDRRPEGSPQVSSCKFPVSVTQSFHLTPVSQLELKLSKFWELEEVKTASLLTPEEKKCEEIYSSNVSRDKLGRYIVPLPFKSLRLGDSYQRSFNQYMSLERRLNRQPELKAAYTAFMKEYLELGHMSKVPTSENST